MKRSLVLAVVVVGVACGGEVSSEATATVRFVTDAGAAELRVEVANTDVERARGLQGVEELPARHGMAFVYDRPTTATFWMKDTLIPLSIAFVDEDGRVIAIRDMEPCRSDACPSYGPDAPFVLAVEANLGWFEDAGVEVGSRAELRGAGDGG